MFNPIHLFYSLISDDNLELEDDLAIAGISEFILYAAMTAPDTDWVIEAMVSDFVEATQQVFYGVEYPSCLRLLVC